LKSQLTVVVPCFNEAETIVKLLESVLEQPCVGQVVVIDDGSTDGSEEKLKQLQHPKLQVLFFSENMGKGAAIRKGFALSTCPFVIIQDADLEYSPTEYQKMLDVMIQNDADAVFGSRFMTAGPRRAIYYWHRVGNLILTTLSNCLTNIYLTDMETCYKMIRLEFVKKLDLKENRFGIEPEITAKLGKLNAVIYEVPIQYMARTYKQGKKIGWKDGVSALRVIVKCSLQRFPKS
jgi:glycosyltransferase involved in cell wall biosynthesis